MGRDVYKRQVTGQSKHTWGRAMGWYAMALVDVLEFIPQHEAGRDSLLDILNNVAAVSYTHLDVYKRQIVHRISNVDFVRNHYFFHQEATAQAVSIIPVSYTHLDVYKRQEVENILSLNSYIDNFMMLILCMGLAFELPLVTWLRCV